MLIRIIFGAALIILVAIAYRNFSHEATVSTLSESHPDFIIGQTNAPHTVVMFFDYNSKWSRRSHPILMQLISLKPDVRIVLKDYPGITDESEMISRIVLATRNKNRYQETHYAIMNRDENLDEAALKEIIEGLGMDYAEIKELSKDPEITRILEENKQAAFFLGINSAPSFVVDGLLLGGGGYTVADFQAALAQSNKR